MPRKSQTKKPWIGMIDLDIYGIQIPVFIDMKSRNEAIKSIGIEPKDFDTPFYGLACYEDHPDGSSILSLVLTPESNLQTWSHEASHLTDFVFDMVGISTSLECTEPRAYMLGYIVARIAEIMHDYEESLKAEKRKKRIQKKKAAS